MRWILVLFLFLKVWADESNTLERFSASVDDQGVPSFSIPIIWNNSLYSTIRYDKSQYQEHQSATNGSARSEIVSGSDLTMLNINLLSYQDHLDNGLIYSIGGGGGLGTSEFNQVGFAYASAQNYYAIYSKGLYKIYQAGFNADLTMKEIANFFSFRIGAGFYPFTYAKYSNTISTVPTPNYDITLNENKMQSVMQYDAFALFSIKLFSFASILLDAKVSHQEYDSSYIDYNVNRVDYVVNASVNQYTTYKGGMRLLFPLLGYSGINPTIGVHYTKDTTLSEYSTGIINETVTTTKAVSVGFDKSF